MPVPHDRGHGPRMATTFAASYTHGKQDSHHTLTISPVTCDAPRPERPTANASFHSRSAFLPPRQEVQRSQLQMRCALVSAHAPSRALLNSYRAMPLARKDTEQSVKVYCYRDGEILVRIADRCNPVTPST